MFIDACIHAYYYILHGKSAHYCEVRELVISPQCSLVLQELELELDLDLFA